MKILETLVEFVFIVQIHGGFCHYACRPASEHSKRLSFLLLLWFLSILHLLSDKNINIQHLHLSQNSYRWKCGGMRILTTHASQKSSRIRSSGLLFAMLLTNGPNLFYSKPTFWGTDLPPFLGTSALAECYYFFARLSLMLLVVFLKSSEYKYSLKTL